MNDIIPLKFLRQTIYYYNKTSCNYIGYLQCLIDVYGHENVKKELERLGHGIATEDDR